MQVIQPLAKLLLAPHEAVPEFVLPGAVLQRPLATQQALALATPAGDSSLADTLRARIAYYQSQESKPQ